MALIPPYFMDSVVAVGDRRPDGSVQWVASGFFYGRELPGQTGDTRIFRTYLVTNRHVRDVLSNPVIRANPKGSAPATEHRIELVTPDGGPNWFDHPDPAVDVSIAGVALDGLREAGYEIAFIRDGHSARLEKMESEGMREGDGVFLIGFPMGLVGDTRSAAIVRGGTLARFRGVRDGYSKTLIVDGYVYPGNSGGPVFTKPEGLAIQGTAAVDSSYLIGVVASYIPFQDVAVSPQTGRNRVVFEENSGLTHVFPVDTIDAAIDEYERFYPTAPPPEAIQEASAEQRLPTLEEAGQVGGL